MFYRVSPRTPVTENDPLGALEQPITPPPMPATSTESTFQSPAMPTDAPVLFRSSVQRSATFEGSPPSQTKGIHRSETVPASTVTSSLASLSSSIKINFRYVFNYTTIFCLIFLLYCHWIQYIQYYILLQYF